MAENEYLKLLGNKIFWGVIIGAVIISGTGVSLYFGLKEDIAQINNKLEVRSIKVDSKFESLEDRLDRIDPEVKSDKIVMYR